MIDGQKKGVSSGSRHFKEQITKRRLPRYKGTPIVSNRLPQTNKKIPLKHLSSLLEFSMKASGKTKSSYPQILGSNCQQRLNCRKKMYRMRFAESSIGTHECQDSFALYDLLKRGRNRESSIPTIGTKDTERKHINAVQSPKNIKKDYEAFSFPNQNRKDRTNETQESILSPIKMKAVQPITMLDRLNRKRYQDLSPRELIYDEESEAEISKKINSSIQRAVSRLLNRHRAATEGSILNPSKGSFPKPSRGW